MAINRTGDYTYEMLDAQSLTEIRKEYKYRLRRTAPKGLTKEQMIRSILNYVDRTGNGPEQLKDSLGKMFRL
jgi:hypothetical protein